MIAAVIRGSARNPFLIGLTAFFLAIAGLYAVARVPLDHGNTEDKPIPPPNASRISRLLKKGRGTDCVCGLAYNVGA